MTNQLIGTNVVIGKNMLKNYGQNIATFLQQQYKRMNQNLKTKIIFKLILLKFIFIIIIIIILCKFLTVKLYAVVFR
jgi:hypothetical protein